MRLVDAPPMSTWLAWDRRLVHPAQDRFLDLARRVVREVDGIVDGTAGGRAGGAAGPG